MVKKVGWAHQVSGNNKKPPEGTYFRYKIPYDTSSGIQVVHRVRSHKKGFYRISKGGLKEKAFENYYGNDKKIGVARKRSKLEIRGGE